MFRVFTYLEILLERPAMYAPFYRPKPTLSPQDENRLRFLRHLISTGKVDQEHEGDMSVTVDAEGNIHQRLADAPLD